ncbi:hypothetical protein ANACAC_03498 [Anaerostipes caccae L1-92]|uniref:Uncharacterized protein n=1 Tax=Anaerostipes caccae (strain DSM 14662 / CCUG 47493 / JCM 13470 / NCIMB 13811 / L1-92) TaxID=411490 RepID=B0MIP3_ANACD|nr:hypothetical protein ANACAC_03498 [Anaerostipes caccae L1-92]
MQTLQIVCMLYISSYLLQKLLSRRQTIILRLFIILTKHKNGDAINDIPENLGFIFQNHTI